MREEEIALGATFAAHHACIIASNRLFTESGFSVHGSRYATFTNVSAREMKEATDMLSSASRLIQKAVDRMNRYHAQREEEA